MDVDQLESIAGKCGIRGMPTFQFYKRGKKVREMFGAIKESLIAMLAEQVKLK